MSEDLDQRFNNALIHIMSQNKDDAFKITFCYRTRVYEVFDNSSLTSEEMDALTSEQINAQYENLLTYHDRTKPFQIKDSAGVYFYLVPHTADMEEITVRDGKIVPVKNRNSDEQNALEQKAVEQDFKRIKKKYHLKDTSVLLNNEYQTTATLTRNKKLFEYIYDAFFIRIDRTDGTGKVLETKYIQIDIQYGC
jgi:hypothetical protein